MVTVSTLHGIVVCYLLLGYMVPLHTVVHGTFVDCLIGTWYIFVSDNILLMMILLKYIHVSDAHMKELTVQSKLQLQEEHLFYYTSLVFVVTSINQTVTQSGCQNLHFCYNCQIFSLFGCISATYHLGTTISCLKTYLMNVTLVYCIWRFLF